MAPTLLINYKLNTINQPRCRGEEVRAMNKLQFPESFVKLVFSLSENFTRPSFEYFKVILSAILLGHPKKTVTSGIRLVNPAGHFSNSCRFVSHYKWDVVRVCLSVLRLIVVSLPITAPLLFVLDDTLIAKYGRTIYGRGTHYDQAHKPNRPAYIKGHNWVVIGLLHFSSLFSKWLCFPILADLFIPKDALPFGQEQRSRIHIAADLLQQLKSYLQQPFIVVADGLYAKTELLRTCRREGISFISRLRCDARLYNPLPKTNKRKRGRPRKYGKSLPKLAVLAAHKRDFRQYSLKLYGQSHAVSIKSFNALWKPAGELIKIVMVYYENAKRPAYFFSTDLRLSDSRIVELVAARWGIEALFADIKEHLGMNEWQCRKENSVMRSIPLTCVASSLLMLWSLGQVQAREPEFWDAYPWYTQKATPSINDMIQQLKAKCFSKTIFESLRIQGIDEENLQQIEYFLRRCA
jgi:hypothetical protein